MEEARQHSALIDGTTFGYATDHLIGMAVAGIFGLIWFVHAWKAARTDSFQANHNLYTRDRSPSQFRFFIISIFLVGAAALSAVAAFLLRLI
jgi:hypothetical protein